jgi:hypothetical protein
MAVISVRFNEKESRILRKLSAELDMDQSTLIKKSVMDAYEDLLDRQVIVDFEKTESKKKNKFHSFEQIIGA